MAMAKSPSSRARSIVSLGPDAPSSSEKWVFAQSSANPTPSACPRLPSLRSTDSRLRSIIPTVEEGCFARTIEEDPSFTIGAGAREPGAHVIAVHGGAGPPFDPVETHRGKDALDAEETMIDRHELPGCHPFLEEHGF